MNVGRVRLAARESHGPWLVISLAASVILNAYLLLSERNAYSLLSERMQQTQARRLADEACLSRSLARTHAGLRLGRVPVAVRSKSEGRDRALSLPPIPARHALQADATT